MNHDDQSLLREFAVAQSEPAFATLVERHIGLVHASALRRVGNEHLAGEITQAVFILLARKAAGLSPRIVLPGWLHETTRFTARRWLRSQMRRRTHESEASMQSQLDRIDTAEVWRQLAPHLEAAMARLGERDRTLLALRFYENLTGAEAATLLGMREAAARKRTHRALEKLRRFFLAQGVTSTTTGIAGAMSAHSLQVAPATLVQSVIAGAVAPGATASLSTLTLIKGTLKLMAWTKAKTAILVGAGLLLGAGGATVAVKQWEQHRTWRREGFDSAVLDRQPPQVAIFPSRLHGGSYGYGSHGNMMGTGVTVPTVIAVAYGFGTSSRTVPATELPAGRYDFIANLPSGNMAALQREITKTFGVVAKPETRPTAVLVLQAKSAVAPGLNRSTGAPQEAWESWNYNAYRAHFKPLGHLAAVLEMAAHIPVLDATGLTNLYDLDLKWDQRDLQTPNLGVMNQALEQQAGLTLTATNLPLEVLVVEKNP